MGSDFYTVSNVLPHFQHPSCTTHPSLCSSAAPRSEKNNKVGSSVFAGDILVRRRRSEAPADSRQACLPVHVVGTSCAAVSLRSSAGALHINDLLRARCSMMMTFATDN